MEQALGSRPTARLKSERPCHSQRADGRELSGPVSVCYKHSVFLTSGLQGHVPLTTPQAKQPSLHDLSVGLRLTPAQGLNNTKLP